MLFYSTEDFFEKCRTAKVLSREEECQKAAQMKQGDAYARQSIIESYLPMTASHIRRVSVPYRTLGMVLYCCQALEKAVDTFDFLQESESFAHRLSWHLRNATAKYMAEHRCAED